MTLNRADVFIRARSGWPGRIQRIAAPAAAAAGAGEGVVRQSCRL